MQLGDVVWEVPISLTLAVKENEYKPIPGTVIYIHPKKRFYVVEFAFGANLIRESFFLSNQESGEQQ